MKQTMKVAITGGSGHLGSEIIKQLIEKGYPTRALVYHDKRALEGLNVELVKGDLQDKDSLKTLLNGCDVLIHSAAMISINGPKGGAVNNTNVEGTRNLYDTALEVGVKRVIHISSIHAFRQTPTHEVLDETRDTVGDSAFAYDVSKRKGQELAFSYIDKGMEVIVLNPTSIIGPPDYKPSPQGKAILLIHRGGVPAIFNGGFDFVDSRDIATAIINAIDKGRSGEQYLLSGEWISMADMVHFVNKASGKKRKVITLPFWVAFAIEPFVRLFSCITKTEPLFTRESLEILKIGNRKICSEKAKRELDFNTRPIEQSFIDSFSWFKSNNYL